MNTQRGFALTRMIQIFQGMALAIGVSGLAGAAEQRPEPVAAAASLLPGSEEGFVDSDGVKIHYVSLGRSQDPLMVVIHGFPDFWYSWRAQMPAIAAKHFHVVAIDQRGYNLSSQPEGVENYKVDKLVGDVVAVVKHSGSGKRLSSSDTTGVVWSPGRSPWPTRS